MTKKISEISSEYALEVLKAREEIKALQKTIDILLKENEALKSTSRVIKIHTTPEEEIIDTQLQALQLASRQRPLNINEAKMLDLFIKNKRLLSEKSTVNADFTNLTEDTPVDQLLQIMEGENGKKEDETAGRSE
jgi:hypothetical protein